MEAGCSWHEVSHPRLEENIIFSPSDLTLQSAGINQLEQSAEKHSTDGNSREKTKSRHGAVGTRESCLVASCKMSAQIAFFLCCLTEWGGGLKNILVFGSSQKTQTKNTMPVSSVSVKHDWTGT